MTKHYKRKLCEWCNKHPATHLMKQPSKGSMVFEICSYCFGKWRRLHYDMITVTDDDVIGIEDGKPIFRDSLFPDKPFIVNYKLDKLRNVV